MPGPIALSNEAIRSSKIYWATVRDQTDTVFAATKADRRFAPGGPAGGLVSV